MKRLTLGELQRLGADVGFDEIGATTADPFPELEARLKSYAERGRTGFEWEDVGMRIDPRAWMPEARAMIVGAVAYLTENARHLARQHPRGGGSGQVTVYSYGEDYHTTLERYFHCLQHRIEEHLGRTINVRVAVDTSPVVDRRVAERAGIGWIGKNCMFYTRRHGSFVFLGTMLVDVDIEGATSADAPDAVESLCGSCTRCMDACPTGALIEPGVIDARRCLSYVTQMKGFIPASLRTAMGRRVWGCDTCQWACPENSGVESAMHTEFFPQGELAYPRLIEILSWTNRQFRDRYGKTAAAWRGLPVWQRNALIALGNCRDEAAISHIEPFLRHARPELRGSAVWALQRIGGPMAMRAIQAARTEEHDPQVLREMQSGAPSTNQEEGGLDI